MNLILLVIIIAARGQSSTLSWLLFVIEHFLGFTTREVLRTRLPIWFQISPDLQMQGFTHGRKILTQNQIWRVNWVYKRSETRTHLIGNWPKNWHKNLLLIVAKLALRISWLNLMSCPKRTISKCVPTITLKVSETSLSLFAWDGFGKRGALRRPDAVHREM